MVEPPSANDPLEGVKNADDSQRKVESKPSDDALLLSPAVSGTDKDDGDLLRTETPFDNLLPDKLLSDDPFLDNLIEDSPLLPNTVRIDSVSLLHETDDEKLMSPVKDESPMLKVARKTNFGAKGNPENE